MLFKIFIFIFIQCTYYPKRRYTTVTKNIRMNYTHINLLRELKFPVIRFLKFYLFIVPTVVHNVYIKVKNKLWAVKITYAKILKYYA